jgi:folate-dependent phosphoribosylglycinamide formyltransferase PurN
MVHRIVKDVDRGEPIIVKEVEIKKGEPIADFEQRLHKVEWEIINRLLFKVQLGCSKCPRRCEVRSGG